MKPNGDSSSDALQGKARRALNWQAWLGGLSLLVLLAVLLGLTWQLHRSFRQELIARDAAVMDALVQLKLGPEESEFLLMDKEAASSHLVATLLEISPLKGMMGLRIWDQNGQLIQRLPNQLVAPSPFVKDTQSASHGRSEFFEQVNVADWFAGRSGKIDLLRITSPLVLPVSGRRLGQVEFILEGTSFSAQQAEFDHKLVMQAVIVGGLIIALVGGIQIWVTLRLRKNARALAEQHEKLLRVNAELVTALKSSALGTVTAHLLHDLKNPLSGLESFVKAGPEQLDEKDWVLAGSAANRIRRMIDETSEMMRSIDIDDALEMSEREVFQILQGRLKECANDFRVRLGFQAMTMVSLNFHRGQIVVLILNNLLQNAIEASPPDGVVSLTVERSQDSLIWKVYDQGAGVTEAICSNLFRACRSSKSEGLGIGLVITSQLARQVNGLVSLEETGAHGSVFVLSMPLSPA